MTEALLAVFVVIGTAVGITIYYSMVVVVLWGWFIVPLGLPPITISHAIGLTVILNMFRSVEAKAKDEDWQQTLLTGLTKPLFALAIGYIAKSLMGM